MKKNKQSERIVRLTAAYMVAISFYRPVGGTPDKFKIRVLMGGKSLMPYLKKKK